MQYEFCHHLLVQVLVGGASQGVATKGERKTSKWKLFQGKSSNKETAAGKSNTAGKQGKTKKKKQSKVRSLNMYSGPARCNNSTLVAIYTGI